MSSVGRGIVSTRKISIQCKPGEDDDSRISTGRGIQGREQGSKKKVIYPICTRSKGDSYALMPEVNSEDENDIDNLMNDSDTEFEQTEPLDLPTVEEEYLENGLEAVIHTPITIDQEVPCMTWKKGYPEPVAKKRCLYNGDINGEYTEVTPQIVFNRVTNFEALMDMIILESERYAMQCGRGFHTCQDELKAFIAINYIMSINKLPTIRSYWKSDLLW